LAATAVDGVGASSCESRGMPFFGKRIDGVYGRHAAPREALLLSASILTLDRSCCATVVDVSAEGASLRGCADVSVDDNLWIKVGLIDALAIVIWVSGDRCGVMFDRPLKHADLDHLRREAKNTLVTRITPDEKIAALAWVGVADD
jgi:hypothetical protein